MALEAVLFPQELFRYSMVGDHWCYGMAEVEEEGNGEAVMGGDQIGDGSFTSSGAEKSPERGWGEFDGLHGNWDPSCSSLPQGFELERDVNSSTREACADVDGAALPPAVVQAGGGRRKRQRTRRSRNREEVENQRMTHIAVERNRRRQMNEYLAALRSLMPPSYVQRGDQASIVGGAINFVKELEQLLQSLEVRKRTKQQQQPSSGAATDGGALSSPFAGFFTFPHYSLSASKSSTTTTASTSTSPPHCRPAMDGVPTMEEYASAAADVEVTMVESHASLKVLSRRRPRQLLGMVAGLQGLRLTTLHLNVTTVGDLVLYSFSLKVEDDCQLSSVNEISTAVHQMLASVPGDHSPSPCLQPTQHPCSSPAAMAIV
ncbi:hypothetical protein Taro_006448 [Colocasia esculenta]|uniref:BHLH domain-containing protein n=1 Tax=Colocasia esculenta TaxID=4460 RepID=A0A843TVZ9_COLES|nr:hypothetical protein [Colocasia esculenta]